MYRHVEATLTTDVPLTDHAYVQINGTLYQVNEMPGWMQRPSRQPPIWLSEDAARVLEWAMTILPEPDEVRETHRRPPRLRGQFSPAEVMDQFCGPRDDSDKAYAQSRHDWWDEIKTELRTTNLLAEHGYFGYVPSSTAWDFFPPEAVPTVRRMF